jgi:hypothetical protein
VAIEIVIPSSVFDKLGKFAHAGQLVSVCSEYSTPMSHVARLVPAELCKAQILSPAAADALQIDEELCMTRAGDEVALLSPMLAFNLGLPYHLSELTHGKQLALWLGKRNGIKIKPLKSALPRDVSDLHTAEPWTPGASTAAVPAATHVGLAMLRVAEKQVPFNIVEYQDNLQAAMQAMQGDCAPKAPEDEVKDQEVNDLSAEEHKQRSNDTSQACLRAVLFLT